MWGSNVALIQIRFITNAGATSLIGTRTISDANAARILAAEKILLGTASSQATIDALIEAFLAERIGNTRTVERNAQAFIEIPVSP